MSSNENRYLEIAKNITLRLVPTNDYAVFLFGSRAVCNPKRASDIDIGVLGNKKLSALIKSNLEDAFEESTIPYFVDIIDFNDVSEEFKKTALKNIVIWHQPQHIQIS